MLRRSGSFRVPVLYPVGFGSPDFVVVLGERGVVVWVYTEVGPVGIGCPGWRARACRAIVAVCG